MDVHLWTQWHWQKFCKSPKWTISHAMLLGWVSFTEKVNLWKDIRIWRLYLIFSISQVGPGVLHFATAMAEMREIASVPVEEHFFEVDDYKSLETIQYPLLFGIAYKPTDGNKCNPLSRHPLYLTWYNLDLTRTVSMAFEGACHVKHFQKSPSIQ